MTPLNPRDVDRLKQLITEQGRILPRQITGLSTKQQRQAVRAIKQARILGFLPFVLTK